MHHLKKVLFLIKAAVLVIAFDTAIKEKNGDSSAWSILIIAVALYFAINLYLTSRQAAQPTLLMKDESLSGIGSMSIRQRLCFLPIIGTLFSFLFNVERQKEEGNMLHGDDKRT